MHPRRLPLLSLLMSLLCLCQLNAQDFRFNETEFTQIRDEFERTVSTLREVQVPDGQGGMRTETTPFNTREDGSVNDYPSATYRTTLEAGSATGAPPDTPADRVDPNTIGARYKGVGSFEVVHPVLGTFICSGSMITSTHVLTAGHCFDLDNDGAVDAGVVAGSTFYLNDEGSPSATRGLSAVAIHPDFSGFANGANDDLAIATLASAVPAGTTLYKIRNTGMTLTETIELAGHGISGQGDVGGIEVLPDLSVKRTANNVVDLFVVDDEGSGVDEVFIYDFDGPSGTGLLGGTTLGNDLESVVRGGDSGGPAFVEVSGELVVAGVNTFEFVLGGGITPPTGEFGVMGGGILLGGPQATWIAANSAGVVVLPEPTTIWMAWLSLPILGILRHRRQGL